MHKITNLLVEKRKRKNLTQKQLAEKSGVGRTTISNIENGIYVPGVDIAIRLARALDCAVEDVFLLEGDNDVRKK